MKTFNRGDKVRDVVTGKIYDYGYENKYGNHICYEEGECNMQDAICFQPLEFELVGPPEKTVEEKLEELEARVAWLERNRGEY